MNARTFSAAILHYLVADPSMPETVRHWLREERDTEQRELLFAVNLAEHFQGTLRFADDGGDPEPVLLNEVLVLAWQHVDWRRVARKLLRHFGTLPIHLASTVPVGDWRCQPGVRPPAEWRGPVN